MNYDEEAYEAAVNAQWKKLGTAQTNEEIREVLDTWPDRKDYYKNEDDEEEDD